MFYVLSLNVHSFLPGALTFLPLLYKESKRQLHTKKIELFTSHHKAERFIFNSVFAVFQCLVSLEKSWDLTELKGHTEYKKIFALCHSG